MKQRFSLLDLKLVVKEFEAEFQDCRLQNVYSLEASSRHFMLKFDSRDGSAGKRFVVVDPGLRVHLTKYQHEPMPQPSQFVAKLRKHIRTRRVSSFWVPESSRLLVMTFSEGAYYLVFEFFAGGNILLLDSERKILSLFRVVRSADCVVGAIYDWSKSQPVPELTLENVAEWVSRPENLGKILYQRVSEPSASMIELCVRREGLDPTLKCGPDVAIEAPVVLNALKNAVEWAQLLVKQAPPTTGFVLKEDEQSLEFEPFSEYYDELIERSPQRNLSIQSYETYNSAIDDYFGAILQDRQTNRIDQLHSVAESRLEAARNERQNRVKGLEAVQKSQETSGRLLQAHHDLADAAIAAVRALVDQGVDWGTAAELLNLEKEKGNVVAETIRKMDLAKGVITLHLEDDDASADVDVNIADSAFSNARAYFTGRRAAQDKKLRTEKHADAALKSAERKIRHDLEVNLAKSAAQTRQLHIVRETYWFEKFWWFLASDVENTLILAGRDEMQNQLLLRRYFGTGHVLVHSDYDGAAVVIILCTKEQPSPQALSQASTLCSASGQRTWDSGRGGVTWYAPRSAVPRKTESGSPITVGDLRRLVRHTPLPPTPLDMGLAILWQVPSTEHDESSANDALKDSVDHEDSEEDFPDTQFGSEDEFPDTVVDSDIESPTSQPPALGSDLESDGRFDSKSEQESELESEQEHEDVRKITSEPYTRTVDSASTETPVLEREESAEQEGANLADDEEIAQTDSESDDKSEHRDATDLASRQSSEEPSRLKLPKKIKGSGKKQRKLKKYLEQDDEDRLAAMERLGTLKGLDRKERERQEREERKEREKEVQRLRQERAHRAEIARIESDVSDPTPYPTSLKWEWTSNAVAAVPMFGPWPALRQAPAKVKLVPGSIKKGKVITESLRVILGPEAQQPQRDLLEAVKTTQVQGIVPMSKLQLSLSASAKAATKGGAKGGAKGGSKSTQKGKPAKKKGKK